MEDYADFEEKVEDLDRRLGNIVCLAFEDCSGSEAAFKVISCTSVSGHVHVHPCHMHVTCMGMHVHGCHMHVTCTACMYMTTWHMCVTCTSMHVHTWVS